MLSFAQDDLVLKTPEWVHRVQSFQPECFQVISVNSAENSEQSSFLPLTFATLRDIISKTVSPGTFDESLRFVLRGFISRRRPCSKKLIFFDIIDESLTENGTCFEALMKFPRHPIENVVKVGKTFGVGDFCEFDVVPERTAEGVIIFHTLRITMLLSHNDKVLYPLLQQNHLTFLRDFPEKSLLSPDEVALQIRTIEETLRDPEWVDIHKRILSIVRFTSDSVLYANLSMNAHNQRPVDSLETQDKDTDSPNNLVEKPNGPEVEVDTKNRAITPICAAWWKNQCIADNACPKRHLFLSDEEKTLYIHKRMKRLLNVVEETYESDPYLTRQQTNSIAKTLEILSHNDIEAFTQLEREGVWNNVEGLENGDPGPKDASERDASENDLKRPRTQQGLTYPLQLTATASQEPFFPQFLGKKLAKNYRAEVFVSWLEATFNLTPGKQNRLIMDIAGGKGLVSFAFIRRGYPCTVIDPRAVTLDKFQHTTLETMISTNDPNLGFMKSVEVPAISRKAMKKMAKKSYQKKLKLNNDSVDVGAEDEGANDDMVAGSDIPKSAATTATTPGPEQPQPQSQTQPLTPTQPLTSTPTQSRQYTIPQHQLPFFIFQVLDFLREDCGKYRVSSVSTPGTSAEQKQTQVRYRISENERYSIPIPLPQDVEDLLQARAAVNDKTTMNNPKVIAMIRDVLLADFFIGMHPDQPTESILDMGILLGRPSVVVPCCVFPTLFSDRTVLWNGKMEHVVSYNQLIQYLQNKHERVRTAFLPVVGRNCVIYYPGDDAEPMTMTMTDVSEQQ